MQGVDESGRLMQRLTKGIAAAVKRAQGRIGQMQKQLEASKGSEATSKQADLIMASLYKCAPPQAAPTPWIVGLCPGHAAGHRQAAVLDPGGLPRSTAAPVPA